MKNSDFWTRIANLYGSQRSPVVLCIQYSVISNRITCLYMSQPLSVVFAEITATFGPEQQVSMDPRHPLSFCACKTAWLAQEVLVSIGPRPHLWFLHAKQWLLDQINKSLWVPDLTCRFVHANIVISIRITSLYGFQPSSVVLCIQNSDLRTKIARLYESHTSPVNFCMQNSVPSTRITSLYGSQPSSVVFSCKTAPFGPE